MSSFKPLQFKLTLFSASATVPSVSQLQPSRPLALAASSTSEPGARTTQKSLERTNKLNYSLGRMAMYPPDKDANDVRPTQTQPGRKNATGLPDHLKAGIENLSGFSLDHVQVHHASPYPLQVGALAYTQGTEIHVGPGQEQHLAHEAWHVVQQMQGRVKPTLQTRGMHINASDTLEREADTMGQRVLQGYGRSGQRRAALSQSPGWVVPTTQTPIQMVRVSRYLDPKDPKAYLSPAAQQGIEVQREAYEQVIEILKSNNLSALVKYIENHIQNIQDFFSPFISVSADSTATSFSTDDSKGGVEEILQNAPNLAHFDVPQGKGTYVLPGFSPLSVSETELLVLLPPGVSLKAYLADFPLPQGEKIKALDVNPYRGMDLKKRLEFNAERGVIKTRLEITSKKNEINSLDFEVVEDTQQAETTAKKGRKEIVEDITVADLTKAEHIFIEQHAESNMGASPGTIDRLLSGDAKDKAFAKKEIAQAQQEYLNYINNGGKRHTG